MRFWIEMQNPWQNDAPWDRVAGLFETVDAATEQIKAMAEASGHYFIYRIIRAPMYHTVVVKRRTSWEHIIKEEL
jgi:hypothetical protein